MDFIRIPPAPIPESADQHMVRMRDGVHLASDVYLPAPDAPPGPTVLTRLPYDKDGEYTFLPIVAEYVLSRGYRMVVQDVRGKFRSEGVSHFASNEAYDGYDTIEWISQQPWSDGTVGMWGDSYYGYTQLAAASTAHPALKAIVPRVTGTRLGALPAFDDDGRTGEVEMGIHRMYMLTHFHSNDTFMWEMDWKHRPYQDSVERFLEAVGERSATYDMWTPNPVELDRFPAGHPFDAPGVPILQMIGTFDNCSPWSWQDHELIQQRPAWALNQYLHIDAIDHESQSFTGAPIDRPEGPPPADLVRTWMPGYLDVGLDFLDIFVRGIGSPHDIPRVRWRVAQEDEFRTAPAWPPAEATLRHVHPRPDGTLGDEPAAEAAERAWTHDPDDPIRSPVADAFSYLVEYPDEAYVAERDDVLVFDAAPATEPLTIAGHVAVELTFGSDVDEADVFARLVDVAPDGKAHMIVRGQRTLRDATRPERLTLDMGHTAYRLEPGHTLRLTIAGSDAPEFVPSTGRPENRWTATDALKARHRVTVGGAEGVRIALPVL